MKKMTLQIFILVLIAGIVGIVGEIVLKYNIDRLADNYKIITEKYVEDRICMNNISNLTYRHQSIVAKHITNGDKDMYRFYEDKEKEIREQLDKEMKNFEERMNGSDGESLYHNVFSNVSSYLYNAQTVMGFSREENKKTAEYYFNNTMEDFLVQVNGSIDDLDEYLQNQMDEAKNDMNRYIQFSRRSEIICISAIAIATILCVIFCVRISTGSEKYKEKLEKEVELKSEAIQEHNRKMLYLQNNTIIGMANLIESRDGETGEHVKRTSAYVGILAKAAQKRGKYMEILNDEYIDLLEKAAPLHDIGKIAVPDSILQKPGKLTEEEFEKMKLHTSEGGKIIRDVLGKIEDVEYLQIAEQVATYHHEKWNGQGYPYGISGEDIPVCARIMAVADVFDALVSKRCYKQAMPVDKAFDIIKESSGLQFDPELAKIFIEIRPEIEKVLLEDN